MAADATMWARVKAPVRTGGSPASVVAALSARRAVRSGALWGCIVAVTIVSSEISYVRIYKTVAQRQALAATYGTSKAISAIFGPASRLQTVGGFTAFKVSMTLMILGAVWGLLTSTRLMRAEEDSGRWDLLLSGETTRRGAAAQAMAGLGAGFGALGIVTAILTVLGGRQSSINFGTGPSLYFALAMVASAAMFLAVGAVTSQLGATRHQANLIGATFLGLSYCLRLIADAGVGLHGLAWATPLGWVEELQPLTSPHPVALVPIVAFIALAAWLAVHLAAARDVGAGIVADRVHARARDGLLVGPTGLAIRLMRPVVIGWLSVIGGSALLYGLIAESAGSTISGSVNEVLSRLGASGSGASAVLSVCFLVEAILMGFVAAGQVTSSRSEESEGVLDHFVAGPVSRASWLGGRLLVALAVLVLSGVVAGVFTWLGAASQHAGLSFSSLLGAGINLVPPAIVILGIGVLAFGIRPRGTSVALYVVLGWSLLVVIVGGIGSLNHWVLDTSVFHYMASAPGVAPNWVANGVMTTVGAIAALAGTLAFSRRDLQGA